MTKNQPLYKELFALLNRRREAELLHSQTLSALAYKFRDAIHEQLGFPEATFTRQDTGAPEAGAQQQWVTLFEYDGEQMQPAKGPVLSTIREDGSLSFAIGVSLSVELDSYPKFLFWAGYALSMRSHSGTPVLQTLNGKLREYRIHDQDFSKAIDDFVADVKLSLDPENIFNVAKKSECMGFFCE